MYRPKEEQSKSFLTTQCFLPVKTFTVETFCPTFIVESCLQNAGFNSGQWLTQEGGGVHIFS